MKIAHRSHCHHLGTWSPRCVNHINGAQHNVVLIMHFFFSFLKVKPQLEEQTNETYEEFEAIEYKTQVVAGINYYIKVRV